MHFIVVVAVAIVVAMAAFEAIPTPFAADLIDASDASKLAHDALDEGLKGLVYSIKRAIIAKVVEKASVGDHDVKVIFRDEKANQRVVDHICAWIEEHGFTVEQTYDDHSGDKVDVGTYGPRYTIHIKWPEYVPISFSDNT